MSTSEDTPGGPVDPEIVAARDVLALVAPGTTPPPSAEAMAAAIGRALLLLNSAINSRAA